MFYNIMRFISKIIFNIIYRIDIIGKENIPLEGSVILAANHRHLLDPIIISFATKRKIHFIAKKELFNNKLLEFILTKLNAFPVNREGIDISAVKKSIKILKNGEILGIFPEGTRVEEFDINNAKSGVSLFAYKTNSRIIPIYIDSNYKIFSDIKIIIGEPFEILSEGNEKLDHEKNGKAILEKIYSLNK